MRSAFFDFIHYQQGNYFFSEYQLTTGKIKKTYCLTATLLRCTG